MKKAIKLVCVFFLWMSTTPLEANETLEFNVYAIGDRKINVNVQGVQGKAVSYILDSNDEVLFERKLKEDGELNVTFDLSQLNPGNYSFVIEDKYKRRSVPFELDKKDVNVKIEESIRTNFPQIVKDNKQMLVKLLSDETNDLAIEIKGQSGEVLFKENLSGQVGLIGKRFEFKSGEYVVTLRSNHYSKTSYLSF